MENDPLIRCRVAACREDLDDGKAWSFYLINDSDCPLDVAMLYEISYEWGDLDNSRAADVRISDLAPGAHALVWRDDGSGAELRMDLSLRVQVRGREARLQFEFPKLYKLTDLQVVDGLGKRAWEVAAEGRANEAAVSLPPPASPVQPRSRLVSAVHAFVKRILS